MGRQEYMNTTQTKNLILQKTTCGLKYINIIPNIIKIIEFLIPSFQHGCDVRDTTIWHRSIQLMPKRMLIFTRQARLKNNPEGHTKENLPAMLLKNHRKRDKKVGMKNVQAKIYMWYISIFCQLSDIRLLRNWFFAAVIRNGNKKQILESTSQLLYREYQELLTVK